MCLSVSQSILSICLSIRLSINLSVKLTATGRHAGRHASKACRQIGRQAGKQFDSSNLMPALRSASGFAASRFCFYFLLFLIILQRWRPLCLLRSPRFPVRILRSELSIR